ncbi:hypothetical protein BV20DRAFT_101366 [Pilatotrama ljubarskyi]|nr:hypothetical protein BV20DRAFT_101366 [Pilatotrama ljubarskyi]
MLSILRSLPVPFRRSSSLRKKPAQASAPQAEPTAQPAPEPAPTAVEAAERKVVLGEAGGISIVDFSGFLDGSAKEDVANAILDSFKRYGFVYLKNFGLPTKEVDEMFEWVVEEVLLTAHGS